MTKSTLSTSVKKAPKVTNFKPPADARELSAECETGLYMISTAVNQAENALIDVERG